MAEHIPQQIEGKALDCFKTVDFSSRDQADTLFKQAKAKLFDVNNWHQITGTPSAVFVLMDNFGLPLDRLVRKGDYIRIDIPGPGLPSANGYDWVEVEDIREEQDEEMRSVCITLRPCADPTGDSTDTAHFFKRIATSSIVLEQKDKRIFLHYAGRNEVVNTDNASLLDNFRNFMVGLGAKMGASFPQWKALIEGLGNLKDRKQDDLKQK